MTNNDELALKLKAAAEKASGGEWLREAGEGWQAICSDDDQVNGGFIICSFQGNDAESNRKFVQHASPANILALLAERDANKAENKKLRGWVADLEQKLSMANDRMLSWQNDALEAKNRIADLERDVDAANARVDTKCAHLCNQDEEIEMLRLRIAELKTVSTAAEKLVRCKGRYHSEQNYRSLAALFGVATPDLPPLEHENVHYADDAEMEISALRQRIAELETVCAESYQVVGALADAAGVFETSEAVSKALDNLSDAKLTHDDVLPFVVEARTVSVKLPEPLMPAQHNSGELFMTPDNVEQGGYLNRDDVFRALRKAGIKLDVGE